MSEIKEKPGRGIAERAADAELRLKQDTIQMKTDSDSDRSSTTEVDRSLTSEYLSEHRSPAIIYPDEPQKETIPNTSEQIMADVRKEYEYGSTQTEENSSYNTTSEQYETVNKETTGGSYEYNDPEFMAYDDSNPESTRNLSVKTAADPVDYKPTGGESASFSAPLDHSADRHEYTADSAPQIQTNNTAYNEGQGRSNRQYKAAVSQSNSDAGIKEKKERGIAERAADAQMRLKDIEIKAKQDSQALPNDVDKTSDQLGGQLDPVQYDQDFLPVSSNLSSDRQESFSDNAPHMSLENNEQSRNDVREQRKTADVPHTQKENAARNNEQKRSSRQSGKAISQNDSNAGIKEKKERGIAERAADAQMRIKDVDIKAKPETFGTPDVPADGSKISNQSIDLSDQTQKSQSVSPAVPLESFSGRREYATETPFQHNSPTNSGTATPKTRNARNDCAETPQSEKLEAAAKQSNNDSGIKEKKRSIRERVEAASSDEPVEEVYDGSHRNSAHTNKAKDRKKAATASRKRTENAKKARDGADKVQKTADGIKEAERPIKEKPTSHAKMVKIAASREINQYERNVKENVRYVKTAKQSFNGIVEAETNSDSSSSQGKAADDSSKFTSRIFGDMMHYFAERGYAIRYSFFIKRNYFSVLLNIFAIVAVFVVCFFCLFSSSFGIFFSNNTREDDAMTLTKAMSSASSVVYTEVSNLQMNKGYDEVIVNSSLILDWKQILSIYAVKTTSKDGLDVVTMDDIKLKKLQEIVKDMCAVSTYETVTYIDGRVDKKILNVDFIQLSAVQAADYYQFSSDQTEMLNTLLSSECDPMWEELLGNNLIGTISFPSGDGGSQGNGAVSSAGFIWPTPYSGIYVTVEFGHRSSVHSTPHGGMDINVPGDEQYNKSAIAAAAGTVTRATWHNSYGNYIMIDHGNGLSTLYAHLYRIDVTNGQSVAQGQHIGIIGNTGNSFGAHLHFEVRVNGVRQNPRLYLPK